MKKFLALVLTLAMVLTLNVGMIAGSAADEHIDLTGKTTETIDGVTYTVITDLTAVATKGNYILAGDVVVPNDAVTVFAAGTVLNGNGYTISVDGNSASAPLFVAPFALTAGEAITITNVNFGTADAPICIQSEAPAFADEEALNIGLFADDHIAVYEEVTNEEDGTVSKQEILPEQAATVVANFTDVNFAVAMADDINVHVGGFMGKAYGDYTFENCSMYCQLEVGDMGATNGTVLDDGYAGGYFGRNKETSVITFVNCETAAGSVITNDWRTGGFIGGVKGGINMTDCVNNAIVNNRCLIAGGFMGYVEGETLTEWTLEGCVNNGDITAYYGPTYEKEQSDGTFKTTSHGDNGKSAGALVGYIYKDLDNSAPQIIVSDCVNYGNVYGEDRLAGLMGDNRVSYGEYQVEEPVLNEDGTPVLDETTGEPTTAKVTVYAYKPARYENCVNYGDVKCIVLDGGLAGAHVLGGLISRTQGPTELINCANYGTVDAAGQKDGHLGGLVGNTSAGTHPKEYVGGEERKILAENCINYGTIQNGRRIGGMFGTGEVRLDVIGCVNMGAIIGGVSASADSYSGGIIGFGDNSLIKVIDCLNAGYVHGLKSAGGIFGYFRANKEAEPVIDGCANIGTIKANEVYAGGLVGETKAKITITNSMNAGYVEAVDQQMAAQLIGDAGSTITVGNVYMYGTLAEDNMGTNVDGIVGFMCFSDVAMIDGAEFFAKTNLAAEELLDERTVAVDNATALADIAAFVGEDAPLYDVDGVIRFVYPSIKGVQAAKDGSSIRVAAIANDLEYTKIGFVYSVNDAAAEAVVATPLSNVNITNVSGNDMSKEAALYGADAFQTATIEIPAEGEAIVAVYVKAYVGEAVYYGNAALVYVVDGAIVGVLA